VKTNLGLAHNVVGVKSTSHRLSHDLSQINSFVWDVPVSEKTKPALLYVLSALIFIESLGILAYAIYLGVEIFSGHPTSLATSVAIAVTILVLAVLVFALGLATLRARPWIRGATVTVAILQLLLAYSIIITKAPTLGWILAVPAVLLIVLVFTPPVLRATTRPPRED
jgi:hypothetical protein